MNKAYLIVGLYIRNIVHYAIFKSASHVEKNKTAERNQTCRV